MSRSLIPLAALCLLAAGCGGGSYCKKVAKDLEDCGEELSDADIEECEEAMEGCTASDEKKLNKFFDCIGGACMEDMTTADLMGMLACADELEGISSECAAITATGTTTFTGSWTTSSPTTTTTP